MYLHVLDTNVLLQDPYSIFKFGTSRVVIPAIVMEEVDDKKRYLDEIGRNARKVGRLIDELREEHQGQLSKGVPLQNGGSLVVEMNHISFEKMKDIFVEKTNDNRILAVAKNLQDENKEAKVIVVSMDIIVRVKADALGLIAENYSQDKLVEDLDSVHKGYHEIMVDSMLIKDFYTIGELDFEVLEPYVNESVHVQDFFIMKANDGTKMSGLGRLVRKLNKKKIIKLEYDADNNPVWGIIPRNAKQRMLIELLMDPKLPLVCVTGKAGTGKTLLALAAALQQTESADEKQNIYKKILAARPVIPMGKDLGYLPGDMKEKLRPWMQPIFDNLEYLFDIDDSYQKDGYSENIESIVENLKLEVEALTYIRGRSIPQQFIIIDEAQNLSKHEVKTILTRSGEGTKIILLGDPDQIDQPYLDATNNGLTYAIEKLKQEDEVGIIQLDKTERSNLAEKAARLL